MTAKIAPSARAVDVLRRLRSMDLRHHAGGTELEVLRQLILHADRTGSTFVHASTIARLLGRSERTVRRALAGLRERGVIDSEVRPTSTGHACIYRVLLGHPAAAPADVCPIEMSARGLTPCQDPPRVAPSSERTSTSEPPTAPQPELELAAAVERELCDDGGEDEEGGSAPPTSTPPVAGGVAGGNGPGNASGVRRSEDDRIRGTTWTRAECMFALRYWFTKIYPMLGARECDYACDANMREVARFAAFGFSPAEWREAVDGCAASTLRIRSVRQIVEYRHELVKLGRVAQVVDKHRRRELAPPAPAEPPMDLDAQRAAAAALLERLGRAA